MSEQPEMKPVGGPLGEFGFEGYAEAEVIRGPGEELSHGGTDEGEDQE